MIKMLFSRSSILCEYDDELILFLKTLSVGYLSNADIQVLRNYYSIFCPKNQSYIGYEIDCTVLA